MKCRGVGPNAQNNRVGNVGALGLTPKYTGIGIIFAIKGFQPKAPTESM